MTSPAESKQSEWDTESLCDDRIFIIKLFIISFKKWYFSFCFAMLIINSNITLPQAHKLVHHSRLYIISYTNNYLSWQCVRLLGGGWEHDWGKKFRRNVHPITWEYEPASICTIHIWHIHGMWCYFYGVWHPYWKCYRHRSYDNVLSFDTRCVLHLMLTQHSLWQYGGAEQGSIFLILLNWEFDMNK